LSPAIFHWQIQSTAVSASAAVAEIGAVSVDFASMASSSGCARGVVACDVGEGAIDESADIFCKDISDGENRGPLVEAVLKE
jgi:hypothetical protein